jgi:hypothetical protein
MEVGTSEPWLAPAHPELRNFGLRDCVRWMLVLSRHDWGLSLSGDDWQLKSFWN